VLTIRMHPKDSSKIAKIVKNMKKVLLNILL